MPRITSKAFVFPLRLFGRTFVAIIHLRKSLFAVSSVRFTACIILLFLSRIFLSSKDSQYRLLLFSAFVLFFSDCFYTYLSSSLCCRTLSFWYFVAVCTLSMYPTRCSSCFVWLLCSKRLSKYDVSFVETERYPWPLVNLQVPRQCNEHTVNSTICEVLFSRLFWAISDSMVHVDNQARMTAVQRYLDACLTTTSPSPIWALPLVSLTIIFGHSSSKPVILGRPRFQSGRDSIDPLVLGSACFRWRQLAKKLPSLNLSLSILLLTARNLRPKYFVLSKTFCKCLSLIMSST